RILVVEDNVFNLELVTDLLEAAGHQVVGASNGPSGIELARRDVPQLILMDLSLPGMDGLTAARELHSDPSTRSIPVVVVTAHAMKGDAEKVREAGCAGYISKPIDTRSFVAMVERYLPT
ncbi:MAG: response regulator, partial [Candidatus Eremiobacteraeota bacterium]|nr:response regulator [Candidatus Eremiobacteraeota bacterium]